MTDIDDILNNATQWTTESVTKPTIVLGQVRAIHSLNRGIVVKKLTREDELIGTIDRRFYSTDSHDGWLCIIASTTFADLDSIIKVVERICAEYGMVDGEETYLTWRGGDYKQFNNVRFVYTMVIMRKKSLQQGFS